MVGQIMPTVNALLIKSRSASKNQFDYVFLIQKKTGMFSKSYYLVGL
jgi:hypothetical protein